MAKIILSNQEFNLIVDHFKEHNKEGYVRWREFCDTIEEVFLVK